MKKPIRTAKLRLMADTVKTLESAALARIAGGGSTPTVVSHTVLTVFTLRCTD
jgi:hypothetical protein